MKRNIVRFAAGLLLVLGFGAVLLTANNAAAAACGQVMAGCNNNVFVGVRVCPSTFTHVGDRVGFTVRFFNNDPAACDITNANITLHLPDGRNILVLSNTCILSPNSAPPNGDAFDCPGTDPRCLDNNPADYTVLVTPAMLVHGVSGCPPVTGTDPNTPVIIFAFTTGAGTAVGSPIPDNINGCTTTGIGVIQPCVSCTKSCTNGVGANGIITFGGSVLNCTPLVNTNVPSLSALTISIRDVAAGQTNPVFFVGTTNSTIVLNPGQTAQFSGSYAPLDICPPSTDTIIVTGQDSQTGCAGGDAVKFGTNVTTGVSPRSFVTNTCSATCSNIMTPCITVGKICGPATIDLAVGSYQVSGAVTNCGNITLTNITVVDTITNAAGVVSTISIPIGTLVPGAITNVPAQTITFSACGPISDFFTVTGNSCRGNVTNHSPTCTTTVVCPPKICVTKQVACATGPFGSCGTFGHSAIGVQGDTLSPTFCYLITVTNCGSVDLTNVAVVDDHLGDLTSHFPCVSPVFHINTGCSFIIEHTWSTVDNTVTSITNIVQASGNSIANGQFTNAFANAIATVVPASMTCTKLYSIDGGTRTNNITIADGLTHSVVWYVIIHNTGLANLLNISVTDTGLNCTATITVPEVDAGLDSAPVALCTNATFACTNGTVTDTVNLFANQFNYTSNGTKVAVCSVNATATASTNVSVGSTCSATLTTTCPPKICVTKQIACFLGSNAVSADAISITPVTDSSLCGTFGKSAVGVMGDTLSPSFCYLITVTNCGQVPLTSITVTDTIYGDLTSHFPCASGVLNPGSGCSFLFEATLGTTDNTITVVTNTVTAIGCTTNTVGRICTNASDTAVATIIPASVTCQKYYTIDGGPPTNDVTIGDSSSHTIIWYVTVNNTGKANLTAAQMTDSGLACPVSVTFDLDAGLSTNFAVCTNSFACTNGALGVTNLVSIFANHFTYTTNHTPVCEVSGTSIASTNVFVETTCEAELFCSTPVSCRVTGGGRQDLSDPEGSVCPNDARFVTHGGQVGAPVGNVICSIDTTLPNYFLGNPCIHGRWTHVRHGFSGNANEGNFHARFFDTLDCACLDTNLDTTTCQYGPGTVSGKVCNPGDRLAGPEPRKAPANKIAFTGVGDWQCEKGGRERRACLFRVDIEDRGEPGNDHAQDKNNKPGRIPDRYRIRIWVLTQDELNELEHGTGADPYLIHFRDCISACHGIDYQDGGVIGLCGQPNSCNGDTCTGANTTGTITFPGGCPVRTPNIDDGGEMLHGNHQIHPQIKGCDPANPTGPGLANPKL